MRYKIPLEKQGIEIVSLSRSKRIRRKKGLTLKVKGKFPN